MIKLRHVLTAFVLVGGAIVVATQWGDWRTGRGVLPPLTLTPGDLNGSPPKRIWIDTDAACGATTRTDPDDCLAILWLVGRGAEIAGISTSFGNTPGDIVADQLASLAAQMKLDGLSDPPIFPGHSATAAQGGPKPLGVTALQSALETGPLTILALGPLTNVASALEGRSDLQGNVTRIVSVMGHRPGHLFHPTEGKGAGAFFGHGPIFRDLNISVDPDAVGAVLVMPIPITLIPYDAARATLITGADMDRLAQQNRSGAWVAQTTRDWLAFWKNDVGLPGFYPFDWIAAAYIADAGRFRCATVTARVIREWIFWVVPHASLVVEPSSATGDPSGSAVLYCPETSRSLHDLILAE